MGGVCAKTLYCRKCGATLGNHGGASTYVSYSHRTVLLIGLLAVKCDCGEQQLIGKDFTMPALPSDWKKQAERIPCPTKGCPVTLGYRLNELVVMAFQKRVYVCRGLRPVECGQCKQLHDWDQGH